MNSHTAQTTFVFLHLHSWSQQFGIVQVKILAFTLYPSAVRSLICVSRTDIIESCWCSVIALRIAKAVLRRRSRCMSIPLSYTVHIKHSVCCGYRRHTPFTGYELKYENKFDESKIFTDEKRSSHSNCSGRKCLQKHNEMFTSSTSFSTYRSVSRHNGNYEFYMELESASTVNAMRTHCMENIILRMKFRQQSIRK